MSALLSTMSHALPGATRVLTRSVRSRVDVRCERPGEARLSLTFAVHADATTLIDWEVALDRAFVQRERYGLVHAPPSGRLALSLTGLAPGRIYWFRVRNDRLLDGSVIGAFRTRSHAAWRESARRVPALRSPRGDSHAEALTPA